MSAVTGTPATEPSEFYCPENFFMLNPNAPALQEGVLGIHLQRIECLLEAAKDEFEDDEKLIGFVLLETAKGMVEQVADLVRHDEAVRKQAQAEGV